MENDCGDTRFYVYLQIFKLDALLNHLSANPTKCQKHSNNSSAIFPTNCLNEFDHFVGLALKGLKTDYTKVATGISEAATGGVLLVLESL